MATTTRRIAAESTNMINSKNQYITNTKPSTTVTADKNPMSPAGAGGDNGESSWQRSISYPPRSKPLYYDNVAVVHRQPQAKDQQQPQQLSAKHDDNMNNISSGQHTTQQQPTTPKMPPPESYRQHHRSRLSPNQQQNPTPNGASNKRSGSNQRSQRSNGSNPRQNQQQQQHRSQRYQHNHRSAPNVITTTARRDPRGDLPDALYVSGGENDDDGVEATSNLTDETGSTMDDGVLRKNNSRTQQDPVGTYHLAAANNRSSNGKLLPPATITAAKPQPPISTTSAAAAAAAARNHRLGNSQSRTPSRSRREEQVQHSPQSQYRYSNDHYHHFGEQQGDYHQHHQHRYNQDVRPPSSRYREKLNRWYKKRLIDTPMSRSYDSESITSGSCGQTNTSVTVQSAGSGATMDDAKSELFLDPEPRVNTKQSIAWMSIIVTSTQLLILMLQLTMCGIASLDMNPMIGPYPDAYSLWGGKNTYLMLKENEWWRLVTPAFLHVGILHLLANSFCQLGSIAFFEREWGSFQWLFIYLVSSVGCQTFSSGLDPNTIAVGSSGTLMGMYAAKLAQVMTVSLLNPTSVTIEEVFRVDQLCLMIMGMAMVSLLSCFTYVDWSGHVGGLLTGFLSGMIIFGFRIKDCCSSFLWIMFGLLGLSASIGSVLYLIITEIEPDEEIADACEYFRVLFTEEYECGCMWQ